MARNCDAIICIWLGYIFSSIARHGDSKKYITMAGKAFKRDFMK